ncbi:hypothetical protein HY404_02285 [Candidatus Microgenomates bacterium]|nr:hypothetical protein [Candidatus Microgenomates bacterium]
MRKRRPLNLKTVITTILLWIIIAGLVFFVSPTVFLAIPLFFLIFFMVVLFTVTLFTTKIIGLITAIILTTILFLRFLGLTF